MRVDRIQIESYGEKRDLALDLTRGRFQLIYGENEAGKSTLRNFIRNLLFDVGDGKDASDSVFGPRATASGGADFTLADGRRGSIFREWDLRKRRAIRFVGTLEGRELTSDEFLRFFPGVDRSFYANYFGFSYDELSRGGGALAKSELSKLLYGMATGDFDRLERAKGTLEETANALFTPRSRKAPIVAELTRLATLDKERATASNASGVYRAKLSEVESLASEIAAAKGEQRRFEADASRWVKLESTLDDYRAYIDLSARLDEAARTPGGESFEIFAEENEKDYAEALANRANLVATLKELQDDLTRLVGEIAECDVARLDKYADSRAEIQYLNKNVARCVELRAGLADRRRALEEEIAAVKSEFVADEGLDLDAVDLESTDLFTARLDAIYDEALERSEEEKSVVKALDEARATSASYDDDLASAKKARDAARDELAEAFGTEELAGRRLAFEAARKRFEDVVRNKKQFGERLDALDEGTFRELEFARALASQIGRDSLDDAALDKPIDSETFESIKARIEAARIRLANADAKVAERKSELDALVGRDSNAAEDYDELARLIAGRRAARDERWREIRKDWTTDPTLSPDEREALARAFEEELRSGDALVERFGESGRARGERETRNEEVGAKTRAVERATRERDAIQGELDASVAELKAFWTRYGFEECARLDVDAAARWLATLRERRKSRSENEQLASRVRRAATEYDAAFRKAFDEASLWLGASATERGALEKLTLGADSTAFSEAFERALALVESELARASEGVADYDARVAKLKKLDEEYAVAARKAADRACKRDKNLELSRALDEEREAFVARYDLSIDANSIRSWGALVELLDRRRSRRERADACVQERARLERDEAFVREFETRVATLEKKFEIEGRFDLAESAEVLIEGLNDASGRFLVYKKHCAERDEKTAKSKRRREELVAVDARLAELRAPTGVDAESFDAFRANAARYRDLARQVVERRKTLETKLGVALDSVDGARYVADWERLDEDELARERSAAEARVDERRRQIDELNQKIGAARKELETLETREGEAALIAERSDAIEKLRALVREYLPTRFAQRALERSFNRFNEVSVPGVLEDAERVFASITDGRYVAIVAEENPKATDKGNLTYFVREKTGLTKRPNELSDGTREQLYLALRLALIRRYSEKSEPLPILMDDVLLNTDETRARAILAQLLEFSSERRQTIFLSCRRATRDAFAEIVGEDCVVDLSGAPL